jgi:hypothetical protein
LLLEATRRQKTAISQSGVRKYMMSWKKAERATGIEPA